MIRGLTHTIRVRVPVDLTGIVACELWIDFTAGKAQRICHGMDDLTITYQQNETVITYKLTEAESLLLDCRAIKVQCRWKYSDGTVAGMNVAEVRMHPALWTKAVE